MKKRGNPAVEHFGRDTTVEVTLPVCEPCVTAGTNPHKLKVARNLMKQVSHYNRLLEEFPNLKLERR